MYKQIYSTKAKSTPLIFLTAVVALILLCIPSMLNMTSFVWIYELAVIVFAAYAVYTILKKSCYVYTYQIIDDEVSVKLNIGQKEDILCAFEIRDVIFIGNEKTNLLKEKHNCGLVYKCFGSGNPTKTTQVVFREEYDTQKISILSFMPDTEFLQILNEKRLDIQAKI